MIVEASDVVPDGTQVWLDRLGNVLDVTTDVQAKFWAMFGVMRVSDLTAHHVMLSRKDYDDLLEHLKRRDGIEPSA